MVEPPQQVGVVELVGLLADVRHDHVRVGDQQAAPHLSVLVPGLGLRTDEVRTGQDERGGEVVPVGLAGEVGDLEVVLGRLPGEPGERRRRIEALGHQHTLGGLDRLPVRLPGGVLAGPRNGVIFSRWSRVSPSSSTLPSSPGLPFSDQIAPVIEALARNREICSQRRTPPWISRCMST
jgi:hypothetical protein